MSLRMIMLCKWICICTYYLLLLSIWYTNLTYFLGTSGNLLCSVWFAYLLIFPTPSIFCRLSAIFVYYISIQSLMGLWLTPPDLVLISFLTGPGLLFMFDALSGAIQSGWVLHTVYLLPTSSLCLMWVILSLSSLHCLLLSSHSSYMSVCLFHMIWMLCCVLLVLFAWRCSAVMLLHSSFVHVDITHQLSGC